MAEKNKGKSSTTDRAEKDAEKIIKHPVGGGNPQEQVKLLGQKARERRLEKQEQRPSVVRINEILSPEVVQKDHNRKRSVSSLVSAEQQRRNDLLAAHRSAEMRAKKRMRSQNAAITHKKVREGLSDANVDRWLPDFSKITTGCSSNAPENETTGIDATGRTIPSNVVWLHGLPIGTTPGHIRRFFSGLDPQRILILPPYPYDIPGWDADHTVPHKKGSRIPRHPVHVRVLVKFVSAVTAQFAANRSGEVMMISTPSAAAAAAIDTTNDSQKKNEVVQHCRCSVGVTQVNKFIAKYLLRYVAMEAQAGTKTLETSLQATESQIDSMVPQILWAAAFRHLKLGKGVLLPRKLYMPENDACDPVHYQRIVEHRNRLKELYESIKYQMPFPTAEVLDPMLESDPVIRLTSNAATILRHEIDRLNDRLLKAERVKLFRKLKVSSQQET